MQVQPAFKDMDEFLTGSVDGYPSLASLDAEGAGLRESQDLFELYVLGYVALARCRVSALAGCTLGCPLLACGALAVLGGLLSRESRTLHQEGP